MELFSWSHAVLQTPKRGDKRHSLAATIKQRIASFSARQPDGDSQSADPTQNAQRKNSRTSTISQAVSAKLEDGNVWAAIRLLMSQDSPAAPSPQSLSELREKHPPSSSPLIDLPTPQPQQFVCVDESEVRQAVLSFPAGSAGGPDGPRPKNFRDLLMCREAGSEFLSALTASMNTVCLSLIHI